LALQIADPQKDLTMPLIEFPQEELEEITAALQTYFDQEAGYEMGRFEAEHLLEFISEKIGKRFYNRGVLDSQALLEKRMESITEALVELEKA